VTQQVVITPDGRIRFLWDDGLAELAAAGRCEIVRASHVEPVAAPVGTLWSADLSPSNGPTFGPFPLRGQALDAERAWLEANVL
jgi:hypothetical protein